MEIENTICSTDNNVYVGFKSYFLPSASAVYLPTLIDPVAQAQALTAVWTLTTHSLPRPVVPALGDCPLAPLKFTALFKAQPLSLLWFEPSSVLVWILAVDLPVSF